MTARDHRPTSILVVEDDDEIAEPLIFGLTSEGFKVHHAVDGLQALELARAAQPDLILLDIMLPGLDGFGFCRTLRAPGGTGPSLLPAAATLTMLCATAYLSTATDFRQGKIW